MGLAMNSTTDEPSFKAGGRTIGVEVTGVDLSKNLTDAAFHAIKEVFYRFKVMYFRGQKITPEQQIAFSRRFGEQEIHVLNHYLHPEHREILIISNIVDEDGKNIGIADAGRYWHSDLAYMPVPSAASMLYAHEVPHDDQGRALGDTLFADACAAYDALPQEMKERIKGLKAVSSLAHRFAKLHKDGISQEKLAEENRKEAVHPVIRTHPVTGRKLIYVNEGQTARILGVSEQESQELLEYLCAHCTRPEFQYRHKWRVGDLLMWDNAGVQHLAIADYKLPQRRLMHRTTVAGTAPF